MNTDNHAIEQANAQMGGICDMVAALDLDYDRLGELREERDGWHAVGSVVGATVVCGTNESKDSWAKHNPDEYEELAELEAAAGDCSDRDDAEQRIQEDALSVEVRSDWHYPGDGSEPTEFQILLCTGGPAVRIMGELDQGEPVRAWLEYQDWFTPWTERVNQDGDHDALLTYARCFYFGE